MAMNGKLFANLLFCKVGKRDKYVYTALPQALGKNSFQDKA